MKEVSIWEWYQKVFSMAERHQQKLTVKETLQEQGQSPQTTLFAK